MQNQLMGKKIMDYPPKPHYILPTNIELVGESRKFSRTIVAVDFLSFANSTTTTEISPFHSTDNTISNKVLNRLSSFVESLNEIELDSFYTRPTKVCIDQTIKVLSSLNDLGLLPVKVSPSPDGEMVIEFFYYNIYHSIEIYDEGTIFFTRRRANDKDSNPKEISIEDIDNLIMRYEHAE